MTKYEGNKMEMNASQYKVYNIHSMSSSYIDNYKCLNFNLGLFGIIKSSKKHLCKEMHENENEKLNVSKPSFS